MLSLDRIKNDVVNPAVDSKDPIQIEKAVSAWKSFAEAMKAEKEAVGDGPTNESLRFWVPLISTFVSSIMLLAAFLFQIHQFNKTTSQNQQSFAQAAKSAQDTLAQQTTQFLANNELTREANEDTSFRNVLDLLNKNQDPRSAFGMTLLRTFFDSPRYSNASLDMAVVILGHIRGFDVFEPLFRSFDSHVATGRISDMVTITRNLDEGYQSDAEKITTTQDQITSLEDQTAPAIPTTGATTEPAHSPLPKIGSTRKLQIANLRTQLDLLNLEQQDAVRQLELVGEAVAERLRTLPKNTNAKYTIKLIGADFVNTDLSGIDFSGVDLTNVKFESCKMKNANFATAKVASTSWANTAWWEAAALDKDLFRDLLANYTYDPERSYGDETNKSDYDLQIARLILKPAYSLGISAIILN